MLKSDVDRVASGSAGAPAEDEIEITPEMIEAGLIAADLISFQFGHTPPVPLVSRVFLAMLKTHPRRLVETAQI